MGFTTESPQSHKVKLTISDAKERARIELYGGTARELVASISKHLNLALNAQGVSQFTFEFRKQRAKKGVKK